MRPCGCRNVAEAGLLHTLPSRELERVGRPLAHLVVEELAFIETTMSHERNVGLAGTHTE